MVNARARVLVYRLACALLGVTAGAQLIVPESPAWLAPITGTAAGLMFTASAVVARQRAEVLAEPPAPVEQNGSPWPDGQYYDWCQGCDRTPNRRLMAYTDLGLYRCRNCRADGETPEAVVDLIENVAQEGSAAALIPIVATAPSRHADAGPDWPHDIVMTG